MSARSGASAQYERDLTEAAFSVGVNVTQLLRSEAGFGLRERAGRETVWRMGLAENFARTLRPVSGVLRHNTRRVARIATRFNRAGLYIWDVVVWSRVEAARSGLIALEIPGSLLGKKRVRLAPPVLRVRGPEESLAHFNDGFAAVNTILFANLQMPDVLSAHRYALPGPAFRGVYLWDSAFIAQIWRWWDPAVAGDVLGAVVALRDGDRLQHVVADFIQSSFTQPPLLAWSLAALADDGMNDAQVAELYPALVRYHDWLRKHRRLGNGLYAWQHPYESGIDNSPRFSNRDESQFLDTSGVAAPDFSAYVVLQAEALGKLASLQGKDDEAAAFAREADDIREAMNRSLWHEEDGCYYDRNPLTGAWTRTRTIASLLPLWAGVPDERRAARMRADAVDAARFGTRIPLPSVALDEPSFERDMWRGPVWINTAYGVLMGLRRYGFWRETAELTWRLCDGVYRVFAAERQIYEFYDPSAYATTMLARKRGNWWKQLTLGSGPQREFVGWSGLVNTLATEVLFGFSRERGRRFVRPIFPDAARGAVLRLTLPREELTVEVAIETPERLHCFVQSPKGLRSFSAGFAEKVDLDALLDAPTPAPF